MQLLVGYRLSVVSRCVVNCRLVQEGFIYELREVATNNLEVTHFVRGALALSSELIRCVMRKDPDRARAVERNGSARHVLSTLPYTCQKR